MFDAQVEPVWPHTISRNFDIRPEVIFKKSFNLYWHQDLGMGYQ